MQNLQSHWFINNLLSYLCVLFFFAKYKHIHLQSLKIRRDSKIDIKKKLRCVLDNSAYWETFAKAQLLEFEHDCPSALQFLPCSSSKGLGDKWFAVFLSSHLNLWKRCLSSVLFYLICHILICKVCSRLRASLWTADTCAVVYSGAVCTSNANTSWLESYLLFA